MFCSVFELAAIKVKLLCDRLTHPRALAVCEPQESSVVIQQELMKYFSFLLRAGSADLNVGLHLGTG